MPRCYQRTRVAAALPRESYYGALACCRRRALVPRHQRPRHSFAFTPVRGCFLPPSGGRPHNGLPAGSSPRIRRRFRGYWQEGGVKKRVAALADERNDSRSRRRSPPPPICPSCHFARYSHSPPRPGGCFLNQSWELSCVGVPVTIY